MFRQLQNCPIYPIFHQPTLELRMATLSALILADIAKGVCFYPADNIWYTNSGAIEMALKEIEDYEASLNPNELVLHKFEGWL